MTSSRWAGPRYKSALRGLQEMSAQVFAFCKHVCVSCTSSKICIFNVYWCNDSDFNRSRSSITRKTRHLLIKRRTHASGVDMFRRLTPWCISWASWMLYNSGRISFAARPTMISTPIKQLVQDETWLLQGLMMPSKGLSIVNMWATANTHNETRTIHTFIDNVPRNVQQTIN